MAQQALSALASARLARGIVVFLRGMVKVG
jgi:hypothetical protein